MGVKLGYIIQVQNKQKKIQEKSKYYALQIEDFDSGNERCILFTQSELRNIKTISFDNWFVEDMVPGRLYQLTISKNSFYVVKIFDLDESEKVIKLTKSLLKSAENRANNNPQDLTKKSFLTDLFD